MADENNGVNAENTPQEQQSVADQAVTDDALSSAWDATQDQQEVRTESETQTGEEGEAVNEDQHETEVELPEEPADNAERSRLGRRLKTIEEKFDSFLTKLETQMPQQAQPVQKEAQIPVNVTYDDTFIQTQMDAAVERGELPATIVTPHDQYLVNKFVTGLQSYIGNQYAVQYINTLKSPSLKGKTPDDIHAEVVAELQKVESPFNLRRYDNPTVDAQVNYLEAKNHILQTRLAAGGKTVNVFRGKSKDAPATGTSISTRAAAVANDIPELDEASQDFIKRTGMSMDSVKAALKEPMPLQLRGGRR